MKSFLSVFLILFLHTTVYAQLENYRSRIQAIITITNGLTFYNTDGYVISSQIIKKPFNDDNLKGVFKEYDIKKNDVRTTDDSLGYKNVYISKNEIVADSLHQFSSYYLVESPNKNIMVIQFGNINYQNRSLERLITSDIIENKIPKEAFNTAKPDSINFAGRKIRLNNACYWANINTVQCPYMGEMNWSIYTNLVDAQNAVTTQELVTKAKKKGKIIVEENINVIFEGTETTAKKIVYKFGAGIGIMVGAKELIIYYVAAKVRNNYVSCVLSHWNNDTLNKDGLALFLSELLTLKK